jgi:hypothetical protein
MEVGREEELGEMEGVGWCLRRVGMSIVFC